jgi:hypothetical protein
VFASQHLLADVGDQRPAEAEHGVGCHPGRDTGGIGVRLLGHEGGEGIGVPGVDLLLAGEEREALGDQLVERAQPRPCPDPLADSVLGSADGIERLNTRRTSVIWSRPCLRRA